MMTRLKPHVTAAAAIALTFATVISAARVDDPATKVATASDSKPTSTKNAETPQAPEKFGVLQNDSRAFPGYNLINPGRKQTYLYDNEGRVVHTWTSEHSSGAAVYLLENGNLFRPAEGANLKPGFQGPAKGGRIQELDWDGNLVWDLEYHSDTRMPHHDAIKLPSGNALLICWDWIDENEAVAQGRRPETVKGSHLQPDCLVEIKPTGKTTGEVVWEWRSWDHLIQDRDRTKPNFGKVSEHPERIDVNYMHGEEAQGAKMMLAKDGMAVLRAFGFVGNASAAPADTHAKQDAPKNDADSKGTDKSDASKAQSKNSPKKDQSPAPRKNPDWMHVNAVAYNAELDQIAMSSPHFNEIWVIDHGTTTEEAKGHLGGRWGKGGDILYRWGNPRAYQTGTQRDQRLFFQHNIQWIPKGLLGEGHLLVFNNGGGRKPEEYSSVDEFVPPTDGEGRYERSDGAPFGPDQPLWSYSPPNRKDFYSWFISGAQRLSNGNTLINAGALGVVFEVTPEGETVWKFSNPFKPVRREPLAADKPPKRFEAISREFRDELKMTEEQRKKLDEIDNDVLAELDKILTPDQIKGFGEPNPSDTADFIKRPPGEYLTEFNRSTPEVTAAQKTALQSLQKQFSAIIANVLTDEQKKQVADFKNDQIASAARRGNSPPRKTGNTLFRATRYALDHPAFAGKTLTPGKALVEVEEEFDQEKAKQKSAAAPKSVNAAASN